MNFIFSESKKQFNKEHPEYAQARKLAWERHPEIKAKMSEIAKKYPIIGVIIGKQNRGIKLSDEEEKFI